MVAWALRDLAGASSCITSSRYSKSFSWPGDNKDMEFRLRISVRLIFTKLNQISAVRRVNLANATWLQHAGSRDEADFFWVSSACTSVKHQVQIFNCCDLWMILWSSEGGGLVVLYKHNLEWQSCGKSCSLPWGSEFGSVTIKVCSQKSFM